MAEILKTWWLPNGVVVTVADETIQLNSKTFALKLAVKGVIEVKTEYVLDFEESPHHLEILRMLFPAAEYRREIIKPGVGAGEVENAKSALLDAFEKNALLYFAREDFPERYVRKLYKELEKELSAKEYVGNQ